MKLLSGLLLVVLLFAGCGSEKKPFETFNPEVFPFDLGNGWEVNASTRIRGFEQKQEGDQFFHHLTYTVDLGAEGAESVKAIASGEYQNRLAEQVSDLQLDTQFELDSTYATATLKLIWNIKDEISGKTISKEIPFAISQE